MTAGVGATPTAENAQLIAALLQFADKRGHWPGCPQSRARACFTRFDGNDEYPSPCTPRCRKARKAVEAAGGSVTQKIGTTVRTDRTDDFYRSCRHGCTLTDAQRPIHQVGCHHQQGGAG